MLSLAYAVPLALAGLALALSARRRRVAVAVLVALPAFYLLHYAGLKALVGWPAEVEPPGEFNLISEVVREPDPANGDRGEVFFWITTAGEPTPRAIAVPYSKPLHEAVDEAAQRRSEGRPQQAVRREAASRTEARQPGEGGARYAFRDRPARGLPPKEGETDPGASQ
jgi:hypothetical protein